jgi:hypothetical protein
VAAQAGPLLLPFILGFAVGPRGRDYHARAARGGAYVLSSLEASGAEGLTVHFSSSTTDAHAADIYAPTGEPIDATIASSQPIGSPREPSRRKHAPKRLRAFGALEDEVDSAIVRCEHLTGDGGKPHSARRVLSNRIDEPIEVNVRPRSVSDICDARLLERFVLIPPSALEDQRGSLGEAQLWELLAEEAGDHPDGASGGKHLGCDRQGPMPNLSAFGVVVGVPLRLGKRVKAKPPCMVSLPEAVPQWGRRSELIAEPAVERMHLKNIVESSGFVAVAISPRDS